MTGRVSAVVGMVILGLMAGLIAWAALDAKAVPHWPPPDCAQRAEARSVLVGETRHHVRQAVGMEAPELWQAPQVRDYPACVRSDVLRVRYTAPRPMRVVSWAWLRCDPDCHVVARLP